jgi:methyl-accepting chemotaxis protein
MALLRKTSLRAKLIGFSVASVTAVLVGMGLYGYWSTRSQVEAELDTRVGNASDRLARNLVGPMWDMSSAGALELLRTELAIPEVVSVVVKGEDGSVFAAMVRKGGEVQAVTAAPQPPPNARSHPFQIARDGKSLGTGEIVYTLDLLSARLRALALGTFVQILLVDAALVAILLTVITGLVLRPLSALTREAGGLTDAVQRGELTVRGRPEGLAKEFQPIIEGINATMDAFSAPIQLTAEYVDRIGRGDLPPRIEEQYRGDFDAIKRSLNACIDALGTMVGEINSAIAAHAAGDVDAAVPSERFQGAYRAMAEGINQMVGNQLAEDRQVMLVVGEFGKGNFEAPLAPLPGKKRYVNDIVEQVRGNLRGLVAELGRVSREHEAGEIDAAVEVGRFQGDFRAVADGINTVLRNHVAMNREAMAVVGEFGQGNFEAPLAPLPGKKRFINDTVEQVRRNLKGVSADVQGLATAALAGELRQRADATRYENDFRRMVEGINATLDATVAPVREAAEILERLAQRDLRARMRGEYLGEHAQIKDSLNAAAQALEDALCQVAESVDQVSSAAAQIASSAQSVASGASEQAASLAETNGSLESVASTTRQAAESAHQANGLAETARSAAGHGASAVEQLQQAMSRIKASAEGTSQIIRDINDIAFQTNLLALNAAVEAARAGEAGRGFAVVAEEVRSLALRAKEAASKTESLIHQSVKEAGEGQAAAQQVAGTLADIAGGVAKVSDIVGEIAAAAAAQKEGIDRVVHAVDEMDKVTQQNAASAEESSSAATEMAGQADGLQAMVATFQLDLKGIQGGRAGGARALPARASASPTRNRMGRSLGPRRIEP